MNEVKIQAPEEQVVVSSRVRLARNYEDIPFAPKLTAQWAEETVRRAEQAVAGSPKGAAYRLVRMSELSKDQQMHLVEHHLISYDLLNFSSVAAALISSGETVSIMVNEEDHLRIQGLLPGLQLELAAELAFSADDLLAVQPYAFDIQWGFLTSCPTNTGTGMRASTMLHLPALTAAGQMGAVLQVISRLGLTVRGLYGEGSEAKGNLYQLSNQVTLGRSEEDVIKSIHAATSQVVSQEQAMRERALKADPIGTEDRLMRSVGVLSQCRVMNSAEFMQRYSDLRLAVCLGFVHASPLAVDKLMMDLQPSSLCVAEGRQLASQERDVVRATRLREAMGRLAAG